MKELYVVLRALLLIFCFPYICFSQNFNSDSQLIPVDKQIKTGKLENGLTYKA